MQASTGRILDNHEMEELLRESPERKHEFIPISKKDATAKQWREKRVSLRDGRSVLGRRLGSQRNKPCPCGSGKKFKKCCLHDH